MSQAAQAVIAQAKQNKVISSVQYPADLGNFYFSLDFYDYRTATGNNVSTTSANSNLSPVRQLYNPDITSVQNQIAKPTSFAKIKLPVPTNLVDTFRVNYENKALGGAASAVSDIKVGVDSMVKAWNSGSIAPLNPSVDTKSALLQQAGQAVAKDTSGALFGLDTSAMYDLLLGQTLNPNMTILFRGPTLKTHEFRWKFTPRNQAESDSIGKIIAIIKRAMHPAQDNASQIGSAILRYPSECLPQFISPTGTGGLFLYPLRPTVVESMSTNYSPNGMNSFFQGSFKSTVIELTIHLQETSYYTRNDFDNTALYGNDGYQTSALTNSQTSTNASN